MTSVKGWIEENIKNGNIRNFEYDEFSQIVQIGRSEYKAVFDNKLVALKVIINKSSYELDNVYYKLIEELKLLFLYEVDNHTNINSILGIAKNSTDYMLVLDYANNGNLRKYLNKSFESLKWNDKIQMALDITKGLEFLHSKEIIHGNLHSKNILVNNGKLLITGFGLSTFELMEDSSISMSFTRINFEYLDPQYFKNYDYKKNKRSDIYSLGVLLWEISSGRPPFSDYPRDTLPFHIGHNNAREVPIENTPPEYQQLYQKCWDDEPKLRPDIEKVHEILSQLKY